MKNRKANRRLQEAVRALGSPLRYNISYEVKEGLRSQSDVFWGYTKNEVKSKALDYLDHKFGVEGYTFKKMEKL